MTFLGWFCMSFTPRLLFDPWPLALNHSLPPNFHSINKKKLEEKAFNFRFQYVVITVMTYKFFILVPLSLIMDNTRGIEFWCVLWIDRLGDYLGSGQFGTVYRGECSGKLKAVVAVKTLNAKPREEDKVRFLQEAAIMGQFSHTNVIKMHGLVIEKEPVRLRWREREWEGGGGGGRRNWSLVQ